MKLGRCDVGKQLRSLGQKTGVIPAYDAVKKYIGKERVNYADKYARALRPYVDRALSSVKDYFSSNTKDGYAPWMEGNQGCLKVRTAKLPSQYALTLKRGKRGLKLVPVIIGKVFGYYDSDKNEYVADRVLVDKNDPERGMLYNMMRPEEVTTHELFHAGQYHSGVMDRLIERYGGIEQAIPHIEGQATTITDRLIGSSTAYPEEGEAYRATEQSVGVSNALEGDGWLNGFPARRLHAL